MGKCNKIGIILFTRVLIPSYVSKKLTRISFVFDSIMNADGERKMTAYLIHSLPLLMSAVQIFTGDQMAVVAHLVGLEQIGYETELGMNLSVS